MKDLVIGLSLLGMVSACSPAPQAKDNVEEDYCQYVNPFIGNADNGHTFPGACAPFGLIQASPESGVGSWRYCSGYNYEDNFIEGFAQTHLNGTGCPDLGDILLFPFCGDIKDNTYKSEYDKSTQKHHRVIMRLPCPTTVSMLKLRLLPTQLSIAINSTTKSRHVCWSTCNAVWSEARMR